MVFILLTCFTQVRAQLLFRFPPALTYGRHRLRTRRRLPVLMRALVLLVLAVLIAHKGIVPPPLLWRKPSWESRNILVFLMAAVAPGLEFYFAGSVFGFRRGTVSCYFRRPSGCTTVWL